MMSAWRKQPRFWAALLHRLSGTALTLFLPLHFLALATALEGAAAFDRFLNVINTPVVKFAEGGLIVALAIHLAFGLRLLAIEFLALREKTLVLPVACVAVALGVGLIFALNMR